jgi:cytoskeletal protein CcmA (bactofilin family)
VRRNDRTVIGPSIVIKGDLSGEEDVLVEGRVEGKIEFNQNALTIGTSGKVKADLFGRTITIEGHVDGNLFAREQAVVRPSGTVHGNITAPRVVLEDGAKFKGGIDMDSKEPARPAVAPSSSAAASSPAQAASSPASLNAPVVKADG